MILYKVSFRKNNLLHEYEREKMEKTLRKNSIKDVIVEECLAVLQKKNVQQEIKSLFMPIVDAILNDIYPYIYLSMIFVIISFLLTCVIFVVVIKDHVSFKFPKLYGKQT